MHEPVPSPATYAIALRTRFRGIVVREGMLLRGPAGWGEFAPFAEYGPDESAAWLRAAREAADVGWPPPLREEIPVNVTVPAVGPQEAYELVLGSGCRTAKVKVAERGQSLADDLERVEAVRDALGPSGFVRVDANGAWAVDEAIAAVRLLHRFTLEYVEQPCATVAELAAVRRRLDVPVAADESIRRAADPLRVAREEAADIAVIKVAPLGGVRAALEIVERIGLPAVVSSALDTSVGIAAGVALAAALPELPYACGLATVALLAADVVADPLLPVDGYLAVRRVWPDPAAWAAAAADEATAVRWAGRLRDVEAALARTAGHA